MDYAPLTDERLAAMAHPLEATRWKLALIALVPMAVVAIAFVVATAGIGVACVALAVWVVGRTGEAALRGNAIEVTATTFPEIAHQIDALKRSMSYDKAITAFVIQGGDINAALWRLFGRRHLALNSGLVRGLDEAERAFVIAQFIGALKSRRLRFHEASALLNAFERVRVLNVLVLPYLRATVYTGDRIGLHACGDVDRALSALRKMIIGAELSSRVPDAALIAQGRRLRLSPFRVVAILFSPHPHLTDRVFELVAYSDASRLTAT